ncbi:MAG: tRNA (adenosine(37)-N6)-threonylcarbamoyltransferase complex transferase subunit TsaD, partial [Candidatus Cloacimonetes bacterium]|nr:tRNA (adenosine(37)-N6)-threonylcarbamoyltransferase complex transferase subunit TsaD [Candidatus Cloacimonadota bacterium]
NPDFVHFPRAKKDRTDFDFSFSGLKTAVKQHLSTMDSNDISLHKADLAASIQAAIVEPLVQKSIRWSLNHRVPRILLAGGVAANSHLRSTLSLAGEKHGIEIYYPSLQLCLDNAAMVAAAAIPKLKKNMFSPLDVNASSLKGTKLM